MGVSKSENPKLSFMFLFAPLLFMGICGIATGAELQMCSVENSAGPGAGFFVIPVMTGQKGEVVPQRGLPTNLPGMNAESILHECSVQMTSTRSLNSTPAVDVNQFPPIATGEPYAGLTKEVFRDNVPGNQATFTWVTDMAVDRNQNLFFADGYGASRPGGLRKYDPRSGLVTTFNPIERPSLCVDPNNNIYAMRLGSIDRIEGATGVVTHIADFKASGFGGDGSPIQDATFSASGRWAMGGNMQCTSKGDLLILDWGNRRIRKVALPAGIVSTVVGNGTASFNGDGSLGPNTAINPDGFTIDKNDNIFLIDYSESGYMRVRRVDSTTGMTTTVARLQGVRLTSVFGPMIAVAPDGTIYMYDTFVGLMKLDVANNALVRLGQICGPERVGVGDGPLSGAHFFAINDIQFLNDGTILVLEAFNQDVAVRRIVPDQMVKTIIGIPFEPDGQDALAVSFEPGDLGFNLRTDARGNLFFVDPMSDAIFKVDSQSHVLTTAFRENCGSIPTALFEVDSSGAIVTTPPVPLSGIVRGMMLDGKGWLYAAELLGGAVNANIIERVNLSDHRIEHVAGAKERPAGYSGDGGQATQAQFNFIGINAIDVIKMALDVDGNVLVSDTYNERIRKVDLTTGIVTTIAGNGTPGYSGDGGDARNAQFYWPDGLALDQAGNLYIGDTLNMVIRKVDRTTNVISTVARLQTRTDLPLSFFSPSVPLARDDGGRLFAPSLDNTDQILVFRTLGTDVFLKSGNGAARLSRDQDQLSVGYGLLTSTASSLPAALANFGFTQNGILISETGVPVATPTTSARMFVDFDAANRRNSGVALVNTTSNPMTVNVNLTPQNGQDSAPCAGIQLVAHGHTALFADQMGCPSLTSSTNSFLGTLTFSSNAPFAAANLQTVNNSHGEQIFSALPVADLTAALLSSGTLVFPQIVDGGESPTQILLMNPSSSAISGTISIADDRGNPLQLDFGRGPVSPLSYNIPAGGMEKLSTTGSGNLKVGYAVISPTSGVLPVGAAVFGSAAVSGGLASQAGVLNAPKTTSARVYIERAASPLPRDTGIALVNPNGSSTTATLTLNLASFDGSVNMTRDLSIPPNGHIAEFVDQLFSGVPTSFQGVMTISSSVAIAPVTLRFTQNQRGDSLYSTLPVVDLNNPPTGATVIPQIVVGGGYSTQIILINTSSGVGTVHIDFLDDSGQRIPLTMQ